MASRLRCRRGEEGFFFIFLIALVFTNYIRKTRFVKRNQKETVACEVTISFMGTSLRGRCFSPEAISCTMRGLLTCTERKYGVVGSVSIQARRMFALLDQRVLAMTG